MKQTIAPYTWTRLVGQGGWRYSVGGPPDPTPTRYTSATAVTFDTIEVQP